MRNPFFQLFLLLCATAVGCWSSAPDTPYSRGKAFFDTGKWDEAISEFDRAIAANPLDTEAYLYRGQSYMCRGREYVSQALADYNEVIKIDPKNYEAYYHRAIAFRERGEKQKALADELMARRLDPNAEKAARLRAAPTPEEYKAAFERAAEVDKAGKEGEINDALLETVPDFKPAATVSAEPAATATDRAVETPGANLFGGDTANNNVQDAFGLPVPRVRIGTVTEDLLGTGDEDADLGNSRKFRPRASTRRPQPAPDWQSTPAPLTQPSAPVAQQPPRHASPVGTLPFGNPYLPRSNAYSPYSTGPRSTGIQSGGDPAFADPRLRGGVPYYGGRRNDPNAVQSLQRDPAAQPPPTPYR
jgi:hypothetical protein